MDAITQLLSRMGSTPDEVAETLRAAGVLGLRDSTSFLNLVIRYLNRNLDIGGRMEVGSGGTTLRLRRGGKLSEVPLPAPVQEFLASFHRGLYPYLETPAG